MSTITNAVRTEATPAPHEALWALANAGVASRSLHVVAELGVADQIDDRSCVPVDELARRCDASADGLDRVLRLLAAHGVFRYDAGAYGHTPASLLLRSDHPMSLRPFVRMMGAPWAWTTFGALERSVRTGLPAVSAVDEGGLWNYLGAHPSEAGVFDEAMTAKARADIAAVLAAYDFRRFGTIADIGGGRGHLLRAVLDAVPSATGVLFDLPGVVQTLDVAPPRLSYQPGDFFVDPLPGADAYLLMEVLHDWPDADAVAILRAIRNAARPGASLLIIEAIIPDGDPDPRAQTLDIIMLAVTGGRERTVPQLTALLDEAGFDVVRLVETGGPSRILEAVAV